MFSIANYKGVTIGLLSSAALAVAQVTLSASAGSQPEPTAFLVEVQEGTTDLSRQGASGHICVLVLPDGRFHLESRTQRLPGAEATLNFSDYSLDSSQLYGTYLTKRRCVSCQLMFSRRFPWPCPGLML
jgi:hypothetical protein